MSNIRDPNVTKEDRAQLIAILRELPDDQQVRAGQIYAVGILNEDWTDGLNLELLWSPQ